MALEAMVHPLERVVVMAQADSSGESLTSEDLASVSEEPPREAAVAVVLEAMAASAATAAGAAQDQVQVEDQVVVRFLMQMAASWVAHLPLLVPVGALEEVWAELSVLALPLVQWVQVEVVLQVLLLALTALKDRLVRAGVAPFQVDHLAELVALMDFQALKDCTVRDLDSLVEIKDLVHVKAVLVLAACQLVRDPFLVLVQPLKTAQVLQTVLQEHFLALTALGAHSPPVPVVKVQEPEEVLHLGHLRRNQECLLREVFLPGNLRWQAPLMDPVVLASEQVSVGRPLLEPRASVVPVVPAVPVEAVHWVFLVQRQLEDQEPGLLPIAVQEDHISP